MSASLPRVLVSTCSRQLGDHAFDIVGAKYSQAVRLAGCLPVAVPQAEPALLPELLGFVDGVLLTGSISNVHPRHFGEDILDPSLPLDEGRDAFTLALIPRVLERGVPLLAICRGFQEVNVALGGSLLQAVHVAPGKLDHRAPDDAPLESQYGPAHPVEVLPGGRLAALVGAGPVHVNSIHGQGVAQPAPDLRPEAVAPDGLLEAFSVVGAPGFNLAVQWHPEWRAGANPVSQRILQAFGDACRDYRDRRVPP